MSTYAPSPSRRSGPTPVPHDRNIAANAVRARLKEVRELQQKSIVLGSASVIDDLGGMARDCTSSGWDGYNADPISQRSLALAKELLLDLPLGFPRPSPGIEPDGCVTLEWYAAPRRTLSVSVAPDGVLHYAALFGTESHGGTVAYEGSLPQRIVELIREVHPT